MTLGSLEPLDKYFIKCNSYKDTSELRNECIYSLAEIEMDNNNYEDAINLFSTVHSYKDARDKITECKYQYLIKNRNYSNNNDIIYYAKDLSELNYKDSASIYDNLTKWQIKIFANSDPNSSVSENYLDKDGMIAFHYILSGGKPVEEINLKFVTQLPGASSKTLYGNGYMSGRTGHIWYDYSSQSGTATCKIYNKDTGELLGEHAVTLY